MEQGKNVPYIALNGKPYFFNGLLDQGYFADGIYLPATPEGFKSDILTMKSLGVTMLRKHIKIEPDLFYYYCDRYGMVVFQDLVNSGRYRFLRDTALPTIGIKKGIRHLASRRQQALFKKSGIQTLSHLQNHPCVCYYTIFNEGWGQHKEEEYYRIFKAQDPTRIYDTASGWFYTDATDVISEHVYFKPVKVPKQRKKPVVLSEFGGYSCKISHHSFNLDKTYGYHKYENREDFVKALQALYRQEILPAAEQGLCAAVLTQVSDVEDETNGLFTYDRQVLKVRPEELKPLFEEIKREFIK